MTYLKSGEILPCTTKDIELPAHSDEHEFENRVYIFSHDMEDAGGSRYAMWLLMLIWRVLCGAALLTYWLLALNRYFVPENALLISAHIATGLSFLLLAISSFIDGRHQDYGRSKLASLILFLYTNSVTFAAYSTIYYILLASTQQIDMLLQVFMSLVPLLAYALDSIVLQACYVLPFVYGIPSFLLCKGLYLWLLVIRPSIEGGFKSKYLFMFSGFFGAQIVLLFATIAITRISLLAGR